MRRGKQRLRAEFVRSHTRGGNAIREWCAGRRRAQPRGTMAGQRRRLQAFCGGSHGPGRVPAWARIPRAAAQRRCAKARPHRRTAPAVHGAADAAGGRRRAFGCATKVGAGRCRGLCAGPAGGRRRHPGPPDLPERLPRAVVHRHPGVAARGGRGRRGSAARETQGHIARRGRSSRRLGGPRCVSRDNHRPRRRSVAPPSALPACTRACSHAHLPALASPDRQTDRRTAIRDA